MAEDENDQPDEAEPAVPEEPQYREVSEEELKRILADHQRWLETKGKESTRANLEEADLQGAKLFGAELQGAEAVTTKLRLLSAVTA